MVPEADLQSVRALFDADPHVLAYHKLKTRQAGSTRYVDVHVLMDDNLTLVASHEFTEALEQKIREALPGGVVTLHTEPYYAEQKHQREQGGPPDEIAKASL